MSSIHGRMTTNTFKFLLNTVYNRFAGWKSKYLSMASRATLIKSLASSIPMYAIQTTEVPNSICDAVDKCNRDFLWGDIEYKKHVHLVK